MKHFKGPDRDTRDLSDKYCPYGPFEDEIGSVTSGISDLSYQVSMSALSCATCIAARAIPVPTADEKLASIFLTLTPNPPPPGSTELFEGKVGTV